jgi:hypothetical protein
MQQSAPGPGSGGNVIALASLVLPGLGQLAQGEFCRHCCSWYFREFSG